MSQNTDFDPTFDDGSTKPAPRRLKSSGREEPAKDTDKPAGRLDDLEGEQRSEGEEE